MRFFTKEIKIALVAVIGLVALFFGMNYLKGLNIFSNSQSYYISFKDITGLTASSPIYTNGYPIGTIKSIDFDYTHANETKVLAEINEKMQIPRGSVAQIEKDMLGNVKVNLVLAPLTGHFLKPGDVIEGNINTGAVGRLSAMIPAIEGLLPKIDSIMGSLNMLLSDPAIAQSIHNVQTITSNLTTTTQQLNTLIAGLNRNVPGMMTKADGILDHTSQFTANLAAIDMTTTMEQVNRTLANVQTLTNRLNSNTGTLGLLMNDASLYNNLNLTVRHADSLIVNLREHPKRYVHFSVFGKKDK